MASPVHLSTDIDFALSHCRLRGTEIYGTRRNTRLLTYWDPVFDHSELCLIKVIDQLLHDFLHASRDRRLVSL